MLTFTNEFHTPPKTKRFVLGSLKLLVSITLALFLGMEAASGRDEIAAISPNTPHFSCLDQIQSDFARFQKRQLEWYLARSPHLPPERKRSRLTIGSPHRVALLVHGFNSSPQEMQELEARLVQGGFTVLNWLVTGFAARADVANLARIQDWQSGVDEAIGVLSSCGTKITVIGHSLGAAITTDAVLRGNGNIGNLVLLAPYFRTYYPGLNLINDAVKKHTLVADWGLIAMIMKVDPRLYLPGPTPGSEDDSSVVPLQAVETALDLQKRFLLRRGENLGNMPRVLAVASWNDFVVDNHFTFEFLPERFMAFEKIEYARNEDIPHCLQSSRWNPRFEELVSKILMMH